MNTCNWDGHTVSYQSERNRHIWDVIQVSQINMSKQGQHNCRLNIVAFSLSFSDLFTLNTILLARKGKRKENRFLWPFSFTVAYNHPNSSVADSNFSCIPQGNKGHSCPFWLLVLSKIIVILNKLWLNQLKKIGIVDYSCIL